MEGPLLELPLVKFNMVMNPQGVTPLGDAGTVYPTLTLKAEWGILTATHGARIAADFKVKVDAARYLFYVLKCTNCSNFFGNINC